MTALVPLLFIFAAIAVIVLLVAISTRKAPERSGHAVEPTSALRVVPDGPQPRVSVRIEYGHGSRGGGEVHRNVDPDTVWVSAGAPTEVAGYRIEGGMVYVGRGLAAPDGWSLEPSLIDPRLPVERQHPDREGQHLDYWPSYRDIPPSSRAAYLEWLAAGRSDPGAPIGYVFLYYYGLERRFLVDRDRSAAARREAPAILAEVERLLAIYGDSHSFAAYSSSLLWFGRLRLGDPSATSAPEEPFPAPEQDLFQRSYELPSEVRYRIGQLLAAGRPIPADWALAWYASSPFTCFRTPATRCADLFRRLFTRRYREQHGEGLHVKPNKKRLTIEYRAASATLRGSYAVALDLPDIAKLEAPLRKIGELVDAVSDELDAYSRWLGRNPADEHALPALALLPVPLLPDVPSEELAAFRQWLEQTLGDADRVSSRATTCCAVGLRASRIG